MSVIPSYIAILRRLIGSGVHAKSSIYRHLGAIGPGAQGQLEAGADPESHREAGAPHEAGEGHTVKAANSKTAGAAGRTTAGGAVGKKPAPQAARRTKPAAPQTAGTSAVAQEVGSERGTINQLERLAILHGRGALTSEEFSRAKAKILGTRPGASRVERRSRDVSCDCGERGRRAPSDRPGRSRPRYADRNRDGRVSEHVGRGAGDPRDAE